MREITVKDSTVFLHEPNHRTVLVGRVHCDPDYLFLVCVFYGSITLCGLDSRNMRVFIEQVHKLVSRDLVGYNVEVSMVFAP